MGKLFFLLVIPTLFGFVEPSHNDKPIIVCFQSILNQYRLENELNPMVIDLSLKTFTDNRCKYISEIEYNHNGFEEIKSLPLGFTFAGENIAIVRNLPQNNKPYYSSNIKEIGEIMNKMSMGTSTNYDIAMYCFLKWKHSPSHNKLLLSSETKRFYLSYDKSRTCYYFDYVAVD